MMNTVQKQQQPMEYSMLRCAKVKHKCWTSIKCTYMDGARSSQGPCTTQNSYGTGITVFHSEQTRPILVSNAAWVAVP